MAHPKLVLNLDIRRNNFDPSKWQYPPKYTRNQYIIELINKLGHYFQIIKINYQFINDLDLSTIQAFTFSIEKNGCEPWVDYKLGDIGSTNEHALFTINDMGFKGITIHQTIGYKEGVEDILKSARKYDMKIISLAYMSHKGASDYFNLKLESGKTLYEKIIEDGIKWGVDGFVIGATVETPILANILKKIPQDKQYMILMPGFGSQEGNYENLTLFKNYDNIIPLPANGREIIYNWTKKDKSFPSACLEKAEEFVKKVEENY